MSEDLRSHIFDPFYTTKEIGRGTGLGLVVVKQVVREHGGEIEVKSAEGSGATFRISFPAFVAGDFNEQPAQPGSIVTVDITEAGTRD